MIAVGSIWQDRWGRRIRVLDASSDPLSVEWATGSIAPSALRIEHLRSCYTEVPA